MVSMLTLMVIVVLPGCFGAYLVYWKTSTCEMGQSIMFFVVVYFFYLIEREAGLFESFDIQTRCKSCEHDDQSLLELPTDAEPPMLEIKADKPKLQLPERVEPIESDDKP